VPCLDWNLTLSGAFPEIVGHLIGQRWVEGWEILGNFYGNKSALSEKLCSGHLKPTKPILVMLSLHQRTQLTLPTHIDLLWM